MTTHKAAAGQSGRSMPPGVKKSSRWSCDVFTGQPDALIAAGLMSREQLEPQKGRTPGYTAFLPNGEPCPIHLRTWREPGFKAIRQQDDGEYSVEITVAKDVQLCRRRAEREAAQEAEQARINKAVAEKGDAYRNWTLRQDFSGGAETWQGTKAQLQAAGLGVGMKFPGEPGAPEYLHCQCPLGFDFRIHRPEYDLLKVAAGIYIAHSWYLPRGEAPKQYEQYAPGVLREVWTPDSYSSSDYFYGTASALVEAGIVPGVHLFPGQPGQAKMQASYRKNWSPMSMKCSGTWGATIRKRGKSGQYIVQIPVTKGEEERREHEREALKGETKRQEEVLAAERKQLRQGLGIGVTDEQFRAERARAADLYLNLLWNDVFCKPEGALSFDTSEDSDLRDELADAFQTIKDAVQQGDILRDRKKLAAAQTRLRLVAAKNDKGLQSLLQDARQLRLVQSSPEDDEG
jgi:hypothetical protein